MARILTPERQKLRQDVIRIRQELGWSERQIVEHLNLPLTTISRWVSHNSTTSLSHNTTPLSPNTIHCMDCLDGLRRLPHDSVDLVFADPPYNIGMDYDNGNTSLDRHEAYYDWCSEWFKAVKRILRPGGAFYVIQYPEYCARWLPRLLALRFTLQRWITWHYPTNVGQSADDWTRSQRSILYLTKGDGKELTRDEAHEIIIQLIGTWGTDFEKQELCDMALGIHADTRSGKSLGSGSVRWQHLRRAVDISPCSPSVKWASKVN